MTILDKEEEMKMHKKEEKVFGKPPAHVFSLLLLVLVL